MSEEKLCRVCRCEGTPDHPLFHPCKCKGSIKYIHQDCLQFWLQHSNKDTCDICHSKFNFKIIYNDGTPNSLPFKIILKQFIKDLILYQYKFVKYFLMAFCVIFEIPFVISLINKLIDFQLGVPIKIESPYLSNIFENYHDTKDNKFSFFSFFENIILPGFLIGLIYSIILISMIIIQNSFVGDEGFQKIVNKKIGKQRHKLFDLLQQNRRIALLRALREQENIRRVERELEAVDWVPGHVYDLGEINLMINTSRRIVNELRDNPNLRDTIQPIAIFLNSIEPEELDDDQTKQLVAYYKKLRIEHLNNQTNMAEENLNDDEQEREFLQTLQDLTNLNENLQRQPNNLPENPQPLRAARPELRLNEDINRNINVNDNINDDLDQVQGMWNGPKNITFILQLTLLANLVSMIVLVCFKLLPSLQGFLFLIAVDYFLVSPLKKLLMISYPYVYPYYKLFIRDTKLTQYLSTQYNNLIVPKLTVAFFERNLVTPLKDSYINSILWTPSTSVFERVFLTFVGFGVFGLGVYIFMKTMERRYGPQNPLTGEYRSIYIILLQIASVVKVFTLIAIEWAFFPLFCGMQIEFALVPIFNGDLYNYKLDPPFFGTDLLGLIPKWFMGTFFMYFFASFVSMIRSKILRTGVLFFIRPSDDPNLQLVHDALMRPFSLRLSRIALSAAVYSLYIHIEFSLVAWSIRLFSPIKILPFHNIYFFERVAFGALFIIGGFLDNSFCKYWKNTFKFVCSKLRLSSFLLNEDKTDERGKIIYKTIFARLTNPKPDYTDPVLESEIKSYFVSHPKALCCFVPDGNYVRVPNDDHVSRNFVKTLFVPVTKSDQLLAPIPEYPDEDEKYNPYGDVDPMDVTTYTIVYRPPNFKLRLFALFASLWLSSLLLTFAFYLSNIIIGKSFIKLIGFETKLQIPTEYYKVDAYSSLFTIIILSQIEIILKSLSDQWKTFRAALDSDNSKRFILIKNFLLNCFNKIKPQYVRIFRSAIVQMIIKQLYRQFITTIALSLCSYPVLGAFRKNGNIPVWGFPFFFSFITFAFSLSDSNPKRVRVFFYAALLVFITKLILSLTVLNYVERIPLHIPDDDGKGQFYRVKASSDYFMIEEFLLGFLPKSIQPLLPFFIVDNFYGLEALSYHIIWQLASLYVLTVYIYNGWTKFVEKTKEAYFANMKILSNAEDGDEEADDDDTATSHRFTNEEEGEESEELEDEMIVDELEEEGNNGYERIEHDEID